MAKPLKDEKYEENQVSVSPMTTTLSNTSEQEDLSMHTDREDEALIPVGDPIIDEDAILNENINDTGKDSKSQPTSDPNTSKGETLNKKKGLSTGAKIGIGVAAATVGIGGAVALAPFALAGAGFTAGGVAANSLAAAFMSWSGPIAAGSLFATLQSAGAAGLGALGIGVASGIGAVAGGSAGILAAQFAKSKISEDQLKTTFEKHQDENGRISRTVLKDMMKELQLDYDEKELNAAYLAATGTEDAESISLPDFLKMFGISAD